MNFGVFFCECGSCRLNMIRCSAATGGWLFVTVTACVSPQTKWLLPFLTTMTYISHTSSFSTCLVSHLFYYLFFPHLVFPPHCYMQRTGKSASGCAHIGECGFGSCISNEGENVSTVPGDKTGGVKPWMGMQRCVSITEMHQLCHIWSEKERLSFGMLITDEDALM